MQYIPLTFGDSGLSAFGIDGKAFIIQLITFVLAYLVLQRFAFKPIARILRERRETIESGVKLGEQMRKEETELAQKIENELHKASVKADSIIADAEGLAKDMVHKAEEEARAKSDVIVGEAKQRIESESEAAKQRLEVELVGLVSEATEAIIQEKVDPKKDAQLIEQALRQKVSA